MKNTAASSLLIVMSPFAAQAVCVVTPLEPDLRAADTVYVGTVIRSELVDALPSIEVAENPRKRWVRVRHTMQVEIPFKGDPASASVVLSSWKYNPPGSKRKVDMAELPVVMPGDSLLVVVRAGEPVSLGLCTPTRAWTSTTAGVVRAVFAQ